MRKRIEMSSAVVIVAFLWTAPSHAQGLPVIDLSSIAQMVRQLEQAKQQFDQLQQTHASFNKLTNMGEVASLLNNPAIRKALPGDFASMQSALQGQGGGSTETWRQQDQVYTPSGGAYAAEVARLQQQNAGTKSVAQQMYDAASKRLDGIEALRQQIARAEDPKSIMDLQARLGVEQAAAQQDIVRMQAVAVVAQAQQRVDEERKAEAFEQQIDKEMARYR